MRKTKCINRSLKDFKDLKTRVSNALGLTDVTITDETLLDVIDLFAVEHNITQEQVLDRMTDLSKYIEDYFGLNRKYEPVSEESKELYNEWFNDNIEYINTPYTPNVKTKAFENDARIVTEENAKVVNLSNGQRMVVIPNSLPTIVEETQGINIYKHLLHKDIISEEDYVEFITEFELNKDKTDSFLYNFVTKILQVNPRNKRDKSIPLTVQNYPTAHKIFSDWRTRDALIKNILGLHSPVDFDSETFEQDLKDYIENKWEKDLYDELVELDKEKLARLDYLYKEKITLKQSISLLQSYLRSKDGSSKEVLEYIDSFKRNKKESTSMAQHIAYELKKKKEELASLDEKIKHYRFSNAARTLKVKNRLAALYNIENAKELIFNRIKADRDSYKVSKEEWEEKVAPYISLYEKAVRASKNAELLDYNNPVFENKKSLDEITVDEIYDNLIKFNPELKPLLDFIRTVNPKLKIKVYNTEDYENLAERKSDYISGESASIYFPKKNEIGFRLNADTPTILHELLHSVSSYGLIGRSKDQKALGKNVIQPFIDYIDNYLKQNVGNFGAATIWGVKMPAHVYGLTNPAEFIAELFSNKYFQELLDSIPPMEKKQYNSLLEEIIDSILEFVKSIFSPKTNETALDQAKQLALAVIRTQQEHMEEIYEQLANLEDTVQKQILGKGENISSKGSEFAKQLTNPGNTVSVTYKGTTFRNAEHAYQTWKSGEFDEKAYKSKAFKPVGSKKVNTAVNFDIMVEIITAKLQQHPELIQGITDRGGLDYILNSTHEVTGDKYWESSGENKFIEALAEAYKQVSTTSSIKFTTSKGGYPQRRKENINLSDITIALAENFTTLGEIGTKNDAIAANKYVSKNLKNSKKENIKAKQIAEDLLRDIKKAKLPIKNVKLNIAGNGIYSLSESQEYYNNLLTDVIKELQNLGVTIAEIRSGGQTGIDEAGIIAAQRLGIPAVVHGTKDWAFRGKDGKDVKGDEAAYKARFASNIQTPSTSITKSQVEKALVNFTPISSYGKPQNILYMDGRYFTVVNINGINIPFYMSSGLGGKKTVESGKWYPFFGISKKGWLNKGSEEEINNYYSSQELKEIASHLDEMFPSTEYGISKKDGIIAPTGKGEQVSKGNFFNFNEVVNRDLSPVENKTATTKKEVSKNVAKVINSFKKDSQSTTSKKNVTLAKVGYKKGDPQKNPNIDYVFTENAEAYIYVTKIPTPVKVKFPNPNAPKINVSDVSGTNQAGIRTDNKGNITPNAYGIVVKKYQQDANGKFVAKEGQFEDTEEDFTLFTFLNENMFDKLERSDNKQIVFPTQMALGKAALPKRFAEWLQTQLKERFGIESSIEENTTSGYEGYGLKLQSVTKEDNSSTKKGKNQPTLEDRVAEIEEMISAFERTIIKDKDFYNPGTKGEHKYYIKTDKGSKEVDISVTSLNDKLLKTEFKGNKKVVFPQGHIGNSFDALVRDYFNLGKAGIATKQYSNFNNKNKESLIKQLDLFVKELDDTFGKDKYKVITKDWSLGGYVTVNGKETSVAGSIDMMIVTESGDIYIYDMKTTSKDISENLTKYSGQLTFYKDLITTNFPEIGKRIKGLGLLVCDINFGRKFGKTNYSAYSLEKDSKGNVTNQLLFEGVKIQKEPTHIDPKIQVTNDIHGGFIKSISALESVENLKKDPLNIQNAITEEDIVAKELEKKVKEEAEKPKQRVDVENLGTLKEVINTDAGLEPVSDVEISFLGKSIITILSEYLDKLAIDDSFRVRLLSNADGSNEYAENYFTSISRNQILTSDVFHRLLSYIRKNHFNYIKHKGKNTVLYDKMKWINKNFDAIVNSGFAKLITLERVSLTLTKDVTEENHNTSLAEAFEAAQREEAQRMSYDIDAKEKSYMDSIPSRLKTKLHKIYKYKYDEYGNKISLVGDEFGFGLPTFEDGHYVINSIMSLVHGCTTVSSMKKVLNQNIPNYPFLGDVIKMIFNDQELKTQFFRTFRKNATLYNKLYKVKEKDGEYTKTYYRSQPLSVGVKSDVILDNVTKTLETDTPELFNKIKRGVVKVNAVKLEELEELVKELSGLSRYTTKDIKKLKKLLSGVGVKNIDNLNVFTNRKFTKSGNTVVNNVSNLLKVLNKHSKQDNSFYYGSELGTSYYYIAKSLNVAMDDTYEISVYDGNKSRMTYTEPTELQTIIETLGNKNPEMSFDQICELKYKKYSQFYNGKTFVSSWLRELQEHPELQSIISHSIRTTFDGIPYLKQNDKQYALSLMLDYASPSISNNEYYKGKENLAFFRIPIMSDKNSSESILFKTYKAKYNRAEDGFGLKEMKQTILDNTYPFFLQELKRMRSIYQHLLKDSNEDIQFYHIPDNGIRDKYVTKDSKGNKKLKELTVKDFLELRKLKNFNGFTFSYVPWFNQAIEKDAKLAQQIVNIINGKASFAGLTKKFNTVTRKGLEADYDHWKNHIENDLNITARELASAITDITTIPNKKNEGELTTYDAFLQEYFWNDYLATCNIYHLTIIDPAFNKNTVDLQKRFAQVHSSTVKCDIEATFKDEFGNERKFSDGTFRFIILKDLVKPSELKEDVRNIFKNAAEKARKQGKFKEAKELELLKNTIPGEYDKIDVTDGQAYSSPTGFWKKLSMLGEYDPSFQEYIFQLKDSLNKIANGDFSIRNFNMVKQAFKPFVFGHSEHIDDSTDMGKYLIPTQIKDSEAMIVLYGAIMQGANKNTPLTALFEFMENSHWIEEDGKRVYNDKGIDTIAFASAVKQGAYGVVDINDCKSANEIKAKLEKATIHTLPFSAWGKQVENPEHLQDHKQGLSSQQRVLSVSDIADDAIITVNDKPYTKEAFLDKYFKLIAEDMRLGVEAVQDVLKLKGSRLDKNKALSTLLQKAVVKDAKYTDALRKAFTLNANGEFDIPLGDPTIADKFFSTVFSLIKKNVNLEEFQGGPVVQLSVFGLDDNLNVAYKDSENKTGLYCEAYMTCPTKELEDRITVNEKNKKYVDKHCPDKNYQIGELLETDDAIKLGYMTEDEAWVIFDRIPTEDKYSIWPCRIKGFLSRQMGEFCVLPKEITKFSGTDFDNDKGFITVRFRNTKSKGNKIKNEIFDMQLASLLHSGTLEKSVHPGSFDPLKDLAKTVDPNFGNNNISLMTIYGQYYYRHNNAAGKEYVGIAALNNICHSMSEICKLGFSSMFEFKIDGVSSDVMFDSDTEEYRYDTVYSLFDGSRISRNLGMFVGASADNAKDAVLASNGCTPTTATYAKGLLRMGIPLNTVIAMMTNPIMKECVKEAEFSNKRLESVIAEKTKALVDEEFSGKMDSLYTTLAETDFNTKSLLLATTKENKNLNKKVLYFLYAVTPYVSDIAKTNVFFALNSTKNSVGPDVYTTINKELEIEELFNSIKNGDSTIGKSFLNVPQKLPFLQVLWECYSELVPEICKEHSPIYHEEFRNIVKELKHKKVYLDDKELKKVYNAYLVFKATQTNALDGTYQGRKSTIFDTPITVFKDKMNIDNLFTYYISVKNKMNRENAIPTLVGNSTNLSTDSKDDLSAHWSVLSKNDKTKQLSNLIFEHFLYKFGFMFHPKSPLSLASPIVKKNYKGSSYNEVFKETSFDKESFDNFLIQYARNNPNSALWIDADPEWEKQGILTWNGEDSIFIDTEKVSLENNVGINIYGDLFINTTADDSGIVRLDKVTPLGIKNNFLEYNANENGIDMKTVITDENKEAYQDALTELLAYNDFNEEAQEDDYEPPTKNEINAEDIFDNQMMQSLLQLSNYKEFSSRVKARDTSVLNDIYQKLRRDEQNKNEFTSLMKMLSEANICG